MKLSFNILIILCFLNGCVYRFTNKYAKLPEGVQSIAVEAIYDTTKEVLPHQILWISLQEAFAKDGHLKVVSQGRADAIVRAHITSANIRPYGGEQAVSPIKDPTPSDDVPHPSPKEYMNLRQASYFTQSEILSYIVKIEIIDLYSRKVLLKKNYKGSETFTTTRGYQVAQRKTEFLLFEEALKDKFKKISDSISSKVVRDLLIKL